MQPFGCANEPAENFEKRKEDLPVFNRWSRFFFCKNMQVGASVVIGVIQVVFNLQNGFKRLDLPI